jgi:hypothetical protein
MANIHSALPLIDRDTWRWDRNEITRERMNPGSRRDLINSPKYPGYIYFGVITILGEAGPSAEIETAFDNASTRRSVQRLFNSGLSDATGISPAVSRYDTDEDVYISNLTPVPPIAYSDNANISIYAPQGESVIVNAFGIKLDILDLEAFKDSYRKLVGSGATSSTSDLENKLDELNGTIESLEEVLRPQQQGGISPGGSSGDQPPQREPQRSEAQQEDIEDVVEAVVDELTEDATSRGGDL